MKKELLLTTIFLWICFGGYSQNKYWIFFDKKETTNSQPCLSEGAVYNRIIQGLSIDEKDYPVSSAYIQELREAGIKIESTSRWLNGVSAYLTASQMAKMFALDFVTEVRPVQILEVAHHEELDVRPLLDSAEVEKYSWQLKSLGLWDLHRKGITGEGVKIAIFDNGFKYSDKISGLKHVFQQNRLLYTQDMVDQDNNVFEECSSGGYCKHGTWVFSILAGNIQDTLEGSAPGASFLLFRTENDESETHQEEDNWVAAAEIADSLGAQVFSTSLGYSRMDDIPTSYTPANMDGHFPIITKAADIAASRGIIVVNSAGNEGNNSWRTIVAPADGDSVIAVGAVTPFLEYAVFSSKGYSADGRVKPDVMAIGSLTWLQDPTGSVFRGNGTSFSCPLISGFMACVRQMYPTASANDLRLALLQSCNRYSSPDSLYGYGIPNALKMITSLIQSNTLMTVAPNPSEGRLSIKLQAPPLHTALKIEFFDVAGRAVEERAVQYSEYDSNIVEIFNLEGLASGIYFIRLIDPSRRKVLAMSKWVKE